MVLISVFCVLIYYEKRFFGYFVGLLLSWSGIGMSNIMFSMYLQYPCLCSFWISQFSFLSSSLFGFFFIAFYVAHIFSLYLFISEIPGSLLSYLIVLVGIFFEIHICKQSLNIFHILSKSCESCDWFILWYVVFRSCFMLSQLAFVYFSICLGLCLHRRRETLISRDKMSWSTSPMGGIVSKLSTIEE